MLLPESDQAGAMAVAERIRRAVQDLALPHLSSEALCVTVSAGLATVTPEREGDSLLLIAIADKALYNAKHMGRNQVCTATNAVLVHG